LQANPHYFIHKNEQHNAVSTHGPYKFSAFGQLLVFSVCKQLFILHDLTFQPIFTLRNVLPA
jgi:hypothetical protein